MNELILNLKSIKDLSNIKMNSFHFEDYIYKYHINKNNKIHEIHKIPEYLLNYHSKFINSISFINNI